MNIQNNWMASLRFDVFHSLLWLSSRESEIILFLSFEIISLSPSFCCFQSHLLFFSELILTLPKFLLVHCSWWIGWIFSNLIHNLRLQVDSWARAGSEKWSYLYFRFCQFRDHIFSLIFLIEGENSKVTRNRI